MRSAAEVLCIGVVGGVPSIHSADERVLELLLPQRRNAPSPLEIFPRRSLLCQAHAPPSFMLALPFVEFCDFSTATMPPARPFQSRKDVVFTRPDIEALIADGRTIVILDGKVLKVDAWLRFHPGGDKAIMHMVGRDATDEVNAYGNSLQLPVCSH